MKDSPKKTKPTLASLLSEHKVISGKDLLEQRKEKERQQELLAQAIEFELRNRKIKTRQ